MEYANFPELRYALELAVKARAGAGGSWLRVLNYAGRAEITALKETHIAQVLKDSVGVAEAESARSLAKALYAEACASLQR